MKLASSDRSQTTALAISWAWPTRPMALYRFPTLGEQASKWLGGGKDSTAAKALAATAAFQLSQKQVEKTLPDYSSVVNPTYVQEAAK